MENLVGSLVFFHGKKLVVTISHKLPFKDYVKDYVQRWGGVQGLQFVTGSGQLVFLATKFPSSLRWLVWGDFC